MRRSRPAFATIVILSLGFVGIACDPQSDDAATVSAVPGNDSDDSPVAPAKSDEDSSADASDTSGDKRPELTPRIPLGITVTVKPPTLESLQHDFDVLSWQTFVALNWPVLPDGLPDPSRRPGEDKDGATVWQQWREASSIFLPEGAAPPPWGASSEPPPEICRDRFVAGMRLLTQVGKTPGLLSASVQPFNTGPLIDQNGHYARFEILVNKSMFDTIFDQQLYSRKAQKTAGDIVFNCSDEDSKQMGAMMVKAAWKVLSAAEETSGRFHTVRALLYTPPSQNPPIAEECEIAAVGLVGLHIAHKTSDSPQWIWSTFEQVDNCPTDGEAAAAAYSFYNKQTPTAPVNTPPPRPWDPSVIEPPDRRPQIVRMIPIDAATRELNQQWQAALRSVNPKSVWQYYELISTQWPTKPAPDCDVKTSAPADMSGAPAPQFLGNSTMESYIQGKVPNVSSSCIECHLNATTTAAKFSDFTYLLERAK